LRPQFVEAQVEITHMVACSRDWGGKAAKVFEMDVADGEGGSQRKRSRVFNGGSRSFQRAGPSLFSHDAPDLPHHGDGSCK
jgi:hypothetical protein